MEDNQFWDELANRLRQEPPQTFREEDWTAVHQRIQVKGKRRAGWFWPLIAGLVLLGNNLIWYLLTPDTTTPTTQAPVAMPCDTVFLIRERVIRDTVWQTQAFKPVLQQPRQRQQPKSAMSQSIMNTTPLPQAGPAFAVSSAALPPETVTAPRVPDAALPPLQSSRLSLLAPFTAAMIPARSAYPPLVPKRTTSLLVSADVGGSIYFSENVSRMHLWQAGATLYLMPGKWGATVGLHHLHALEKPAQTGPELGWPAACPTCPASPDFPDRVSLQWTEFQAGLAYRVPLSNRKTEILLSVAGHLRSPVVQYRHFRFENYGGPLVELEDRNREASGLYWNGWSSRMSVIHRITGNFGVSGSVQGRWTSGVNPEIMPASVGLNAGLVWYVR